VVMYALAGGLFTPVFTGNLLVERARGAPAAPLLALEVAALLALVAVALADVIGLGSAIAPLALAAFALQAWRVARWRGWRVADDALVGSMHLGFVWLLVALLLKALAHLGAPWSESLWVHAFTVGALGSMLLGLMTRVVLRHTGRPLAAPRVLPWLLGLVNLAAVLRLIAPVLGGWAWPAASLLWAATFAAWLWRHARAMGRASLPRRD
ncbi:MAG TPA: NnrS family protein, partial [Burkholderiaceae bacterium]|nr:NnrS family protein [Burkholderiaceae bacterium]